LGILDWGSFAQQWFQPANYRAFYLSWCDYRYITTVAPQTVGQPVELNAKSNAALALLKNQQDTPTSRQPLASWRFKLGKFVTITSHLSLMLEVSSFSNWLYLLRRR
jgi:hypothetical protein